MARPGALAYLAWRALVAHPLKRLFRRRGTGLERFHAAYVSEGLVPTLPEDRAAGEAASACIACGLCETGCDLAAADAGGARPRDPRRLPALLAQLRRAAARGRGARRVRRVRRLRRALPDAASRSRGSSPTSGARTRRGARAGLLSSSG